ncbi:uncharacterized mitochondrial protein AtMg00810-like [Hevea brasiliensis]|uniref:uncharacterized mitochondrial protein AtMg00810-like n=1 Tax=Hevea brasiliensis TaxID=3981 RepID=UPI0025E7B12C|nr:uncharacterized mitochondrial protein AtMg00810-like [Hevea brasiliensis]
MDDVLITGTSEVLIITIKKFLDDEFTIKDMGYAKYFLGIELAQSSNGLFISQRKYILDMLQDASLSNAKPASFPMTKSLHSTTEMGDLMLEPEKYRRIVGKLLDVDWVACPTSRRSITGYCIFLGSTLVSWKSKKQPTVSRSSAKAEYCSMASTTCKLKWISFLLANFKIPMQTLISLHCDNQAAIHISNNPTFHERTKHIDIDCQVVWQHIIDEFLMTVHTPS